VVAVKIENATVKKRFKLQWVKCNDMNFPQYRMLINAKVIYKIIDERNFEEKQRTGSRVIQFKMEAKQYPEILKIKDILNCSDQLYLIKEEKDWLEF
jgi:hypothetical protein